MTDAIEEKRQRGRPPKSEEEKEESRNRPRSPRHVFFGKPKTGHTDKSEPAKRLAAAVVGRAVADYYNERSAGRDESADTIQRWILSENWCHLTLDLDPDIYGDMIKKANKAIKKGLTHAEFSRHGATARN